MSLEKELIEHLSSEIKTLTEQLMAFRMRVGFSVWIGPFVVVGAYLLSTKDGQRNPHFDWIGIAFAGFAVALLVILGEALARIEIHCWEQCNKWRKLIGQLSINQPVDANELLFKHNIHRGYRWLTYLILLIFISVVVAAVRFLGGGGNCSGNVV
jgi:hypothetical protein